MIPRYRCEHQAHEAHERSVRPNGPGERSPGLRPQAELPAEQREVFLAHEVEGRTFRELAASTGLSINTLLGRKRYAVLRLRARLRDTYLDFTGN